MKILIIYYSRTGTTKEMAYLVAEGVKKIKGIEAIVKDVKDVSLPELKEVEGIIIGSPTYYGGMAAEVKKLLDESVKFHGSLSGKVGGAFSSSANIGGGNETTIRNILDAMLIHGMIIQGEHYGDHYGPVCVGKIDKRVKKGCKDLGERVARLVQKLYGD